MIRRTVVISKPSFLSTRNEQLRIRYKVDGEEERSVPIEDIGILLIENQQITITNGLLTKLALRKIAVINCDHRHMPTALMLPMEGHTLLGERYQQQIKASIPLKKGLWKQTVQAKILNQGRVLEKLGENPAPMYKWRMNVHSGDSGFHESRAAAYYWPRLMGSEVFRRDPDGDPPNNFFNYSYAILRAIIARAIVGSGLLPTFGIFHKNKYNAYALADDIMEPFRPFADGLVMDLYLKNSNCKELTPKTKRHLLTLPTLDVKAEGKWSPLLVAASRTSNSLYECFAGIRKKIIYPEYEIK